jgi:sulfatase maturation enzyme AslB (radical SAM superfamily)
MNKLSIQWQIGNQCNFRCDYCHPDCYDGSNPFLEYTKFQKGFENLQASVDSYDLIEIEFQGGEPTVSQAIRDKLSSDTDPRYRYILTTNASADLEFWKLAAPNFNNVVLAWHHQISTEHFNNVVKLMHENNVPMGIVINAPTDINQWKSAQEVYEQYKALGLYVQFKALYKNYQRGNNEFLPYNQEQWDYYTKVNNIQPPKEEPVETQIQWVQERLYNNYKGHLCYAGVNQIVIDYRGYALRGWCGANGSFGCVFDQPLILDAQPRVCPRDICKNGFDQQAKKSQNSWGFA